MNAKVKLGHILKLAILLGLLSMIGDCSQFFFYPQKAFFQTPDDIGLTYEDVYVTTQDNLTLHGWLLKAEKPKGIVFFLHGNAENISTHIQSVAWLPDAGYEVVLMDYRGYGKSEGHPDLPDVFMDVEAFYKWLKSYSQSHNLSVTILGQSLGAAISSYYFGSLPKQKVIYQGIILDSVFSGYRAIAKDVLNQQYLTWPLQFIVPHFLPKDYDPQQFVEQIAPTPILFIHSPEDSIIPFQHGKTVYDKARSPKYWLTSQGSHIATFHFPVYQEAVLTFISNPESYLAP